MEKEPVQKYEENPFEDPKIAGEWIRSVEGEQGMIRDREIYPMLQEWASNIKGRIIEIGSGQGICSQHLGTFPGTYVGVEPSVPLTERAQELYAKTESSDFVVGNAYQLPIESDSADGVFSVNVWFHLADLSTAGKELARVLKESAVFNIITANPESYHVWENSFTNYTKDAKKIVGQARMPVNPLSRNDFYLHTIEQIQQSLERNGLIVDKIEPLGIMSAYPDNPLFISIRGRKKTREEN